MNDRKQHVMNMAHQLFIEKGFQATSIQDILEYSGIAKGTFYNYFSSKNELLIDLLKMLNKKMEKERNELLIGEDPSSIEIFIKQIELQMKLNRVNNFTSLFEEVVYLDDAELKQLIRKGHLRMIRWLFERFLDIFGESKKPYLLDCAIMFLGILNNNLKYSFNAYGSNTSVHNVVRYSVSRISGIVNEAAKTGEQLIPPDILDDWLPPYNQFNQSFRQKLRQNILTLKKNLNQTEEQEKYVELLDFIQDELLHSKEPRKYLIESTLHSLKSAKAPFEEKDYESLQQLVNVYFTQI